MTQPESTPPKAVRNAPEISMADMRQSYALAGLSRDDVNKDPVVQFQAWFANATGVGTDGETVPELQTPDWLEPNAMTLSTSDKTGHVSSRIVLLKGIDEGRFLFYTNYDSAKARQIRDNPQVCLCFHWPHLQRQVRIEGDVSKIGRRESEAYFHSRPRDSQLGAHISEQSSEIASRGVLESAMQRLEALYPEGEIVPIPDNWGGYAVRPNFFEFWQGRPSRLHDRIVYRHRPDGWWIARVAP